MQGIGKEKQMTIGTDLPWSAGKTMEQGQNKPTPQATAVRVQNPELLLQASRRLDWRFLLPDPALEAVAYLGPKSGTLLDALRLFATKLTILPPTVNQPGERYTVVVVCEPSPRQLRAAVGLVRPGGALYVEAHGLLWPAKWLRRNPRSFLQRPHLWQPADYVQALQEWGLSEASAYWFWPDFESCTRIIPLAEPVVLAHAFAAPTARRGAKARLKAAYKRWLVQSGWLTLTQPSFGIVAH